MIRKYKLPQKEGVIQSLLDPGVLVETSSPCLFMIYKLLIASLYLQLQLCWTQILFWILCFQIKSNKQLWILVLHFFSIPLHRDSQYLLAFVITIVITVSRKKWAPLCARVFVKQNLPRGSPEGATCSLRRLPAMHIVQDCGGQLGATGEHTDVHLMCSMATC